MSFLKFSFYRREQSSQKSSSPSALAHEVVMAVAIASRYPDIRLGAFRHESSSTRALFSHDSTSSSLASFTSLQSDRQLHKSSSVSGSSESGSDQFLEEDTFDEGSSCASHDGEPSQLQRRGLRKERSSKILFSRRKSSQASAEKEESNVRPSDDIEAGGEAFDCPEAGISFRSRAPSKVLYDCRQGNGACAVGSDRPAKKTSNGQLKNSNHIESRNGVLPAAPEEGPTGSTDSHRLKKQSSRVLFRRSSPSNSRGHQNDSSQTSISTEQPRHDMGRHSTTECRHDKNSTCADVPGCQTIAETSVDEERAEQTEDVVNPEMRPRCASKVLFSAAARPVNTDYYV